MRYFFDLKLNKLYFIIVYGRFGIGVGFKDFGGCEFWNVVYFL